MPPVRAHAEAAYASQALNSMRGVIDRLQRYLPGTIARIQRNGIIQTGGGVHMVAIRTHRHSMCTFKRTCIGAAGFEHLQWRQEILGMQWHGHAETHPRQTDRKIQLDVIHGFTETPAGFVTEVLRFIGSSLVHDTVREARALACAKRGTDAASAGSLCE